MTGLHTFFILLGLINLITLMKRITKLCSVKFSSFSGTFPYITLGQGAHFEFFTLAGVGGKG
jgi:hypothetical protein